MREIVRLRQTQIAPLPSGSLIQIKIEGCGLLKIGEEGIDWQTTRSAQPRHLGATPLSPLSCRNPSLLGRFSWMQLTNLKFITLQKLRGQGSLFGNFHAKEMTRSNLSFVAKSMQLMFVDIYYMTSTKGEASDVKSTFSSQRNAK